MALPSFIIVGAMKGGTSSLGHALGMHPQIYIPRDEVHFFNVDERFAIGLPLYEKYFIDNPGKPFIGEKTPTYSYQENVPERIAKLLPRTKLIWIFREPVSRAYSHYWFFVSMGKERLSFEKALEREKRGNTDDFTMRYRDRSLYVTQVERYLRYFPKEQMLFLLSKDLNNNQQNVLSQTCKFLGADTSFQFPSRPIKENITSQPKNVFLQWATYHLFNTRGARILRFIKKINRKTVTGYPSLSDSIQKELRAFYTPHNQKLSALTGLDVSDWMDKTE